MAITTTVKIEKDITSDQIRKIYADAYGSSPFVKIAFPSIPETKHVWGSNRCDISWHQEGENLILLSVIDNLIKGASGQAIQNMNIRFGLEETEALNLHGEI